MNGLSEDVGENETKVIAHDLICKSPAKIFLPGEPIITL
jgi:hypothetical protein